MTLIADEHDVLAHPDRYRVLTGDRPTGRLHLGHYLGTLRNRVRLQDAGVETFVVVADYQVITDRARPGDLVRHVREIVLDYLAVGLDPRRTTIFVHSAVPALNQLMLPFLSLVSVSELSRSPTVKAEHAAAGGAAVGGLLLTYPVHQAADICSCHGNLVPVGADQLPHVEQTRAIVRRFNDRYAAGRPVLTVPQALLSPAPVLLGVDGRKMSKSRGNAIDIGADADQTRALVRRAVTDGQRQITYDPVGRPAVSNLVLVAALLRDEDPYDVAARIGGGGAAALKALVTDAINDSLAGVRSRRADLAHQPDVVDDVLAAGNARVNEIATVTLDEVSAAMGMRYPVYVRAGRGTRRPDGPGARSVRA